MGTRQLKTITGGKKHLIALLKSSFPTIYAFMMLWLLKYEMKTFSPFPTPLCWLSGNFTPRTPPRQEHSPFQCPEVETQLLRQWPQTHRLFTSCILPNSSESDSPGCVRRKNRPALTHSQRASSPLQTPGAFPGAEVAFPRGKKSFDFLAAAFNPVFTAWAHLPT